jgi:hypothetical protein
MGLPKVQESSSSNSPAAAAQSAAAPADSSAKVVALRALGALDSQSTDMVKTTARSWMPSTRTLCLIGGVATFKAALIASLYFLGAKVTLSSTVLGTAYTANLALTAAGIASAPLFSIAMNSVILPVVLPAAGATVGLILVAKLFAMVLKDIGGPFAKAGERIDSLVSFTTLLNFIKGLIFPSKEVEMKDMASTSSLDKAIDAAVDTLVVKPLEIANKAVDKVIEKAATATITVSAAVGSAALTMLTEAAKGQAEMRENLLEKSIIDNDDAPIFTLADSDDENNDMVSNIFGFFFGGASSVDSEDEHALLF